MKTLLTASDWIVRAPEGGAGGGDGPSAADTSAAPAPSSETAPSAPSPSENDSAILAAGYEEPALSESDFGFGDQDISDAPAGDDRSVAPASVPSVPVSPTPPVQTPAAAQPQTSSPAVAPESPVATQPTVPQSAAPSDAPAAAPSQGGQVPTSLTALMESQQDQLIAGAAQKFQLPAEVTQAMESGDMSPLPVLAAKVYTESLIAMTGLLERALPSLVANLIQQTKQVSGFEEEFFTQHSDLKPHGDKLGVLARDLRALNPNMPREEFGQKLAAYARVMLGVQPGVVPVQEAARAAGNGHLSQVPAGFAPAVGGNATMQPNLSGDAWAQFDQDMISGVL